jgi:peptide/nickel transport system ATP-binding protein
LDLVTQEETTRALMEQVDKQDCALLLVTHDEALAEAVAGRTVFLGDKGRVSEIKAPA